MSTNERLTSQSFDALRCSRCQRTPIEVRTLLDSGSGRTVQMFECECGERNWQDSPAHSSHRAP
jgi:hypothetical protein